jgi:trimeric autotransporter adhesin
LTLAYGFRGSPAVTATTFAVDPLFRVGEAHNWQASVQHDLPAAMQATVTYLGIKGTHVPTRIVPNTFPAGADNPCARCPLGFVYLASNGSSRRHSATIDLRRRQRSGFEAGASYTFAKATDDAGLGGYLIAQNWLDPGAEWGPSNFDRRHQLSVQSQFTSGFLARGGLFSNSWKEKLFAQWTISAQLTVGSGTPLTPVFLAPVRGTGITGSLRPDVTGAPINVNADGRHVNPLAFAAPVAGQWGNAGRNSIRGPSQFELNASFARSFRFSQRVSMDFSVAATNLLNRVTYPDWNTLVGSSQFGLPTRANGMRTLQPSFRLNF